MALRDKQRLDEQVKAPAREHETAPGQTCPESRTAEMSLKGG
jgi:hypothetical protein